MLEEMSAKMMWLSYVAELTHKLKKSGWEIWSNNVLVAYWSNEIPKRNCRDERLAGKRSDCGW